MPGLAVAQAAPQRIVTVRDAETGNLIRRLSHPLMRTAGVDPALVRTTLIQDRAINAFVSTGNRLFIHTGLIQRAESAAELAGVPAHQTGRMLRSGVAMPLGGAAAAASGPAGAGASAILGGQAAVSCLERLGWSPHGIERLLDQELLPAGWQDPYFRTHPLSRDWRGDNPGVDPALAEEVLLLGGGPMMRMLADRAEAALPPNPQRLRPADTAKAAAPGNLPRRPRN